MKEDIKYYNANFIQGYNDVVVIEADEFDRSFHRLAPDMAVITAVDTDHLDIYGTKESIDEAFVKAIKLKAVVVDLLSRAIICEMRMV
jgi:UDP-N-acetylmuramate-alanine ligase